MATLDVTAFLGPEGPIARRLAGYEPRTEQVRMAEAVDQALAGRRRLVVEAGTGVGKSFAYLLPAIRRIIEHRERVIVATNTISLQEQLMDKDIPLLRAVIPDEFSAVLVKGRGNYLSLRRLKLASERQDRLFSDDDARHSLHALEDWAYTTRDGTLATLPMLRRPEVWDAAQSDAHNCMGRKCPTFEKCFYQTARRRMENGHLLICNHALFFADLALRAHGASMLPAYDHVILDEAHAVEDVASEHFGLTLSESGVRHLLRTLYRPHNGTGFLAALGVKDGAREMLDGAMTLVMRAGDSAERLFADLQRWAEHHANQNGLMEEPGAVPEALSGPLNELADRLVLLKRKAVTEADEFELNSYAQRARDMASSAQALIAQAMPDCVHWVELGRGGAHSVRPRVTLRAAPIEVGPALREHLFSRDIGIVLTSATLATAAGDFSHIGARLGCDNPATLQLGSPFDYAKQARLIVDRTMPDPSDPGYTEALCPRVLAHIRATDGGAFVLFTSFSVLRAVAQRLRASLEALGHPVFVQGEDASRSVLLARFRDDERSVLFGTASFWQGVDVRGRALRNVIITRLPFDVPDRPLIRARLRRIEERGGNPFLEDQVPRAVIRFKQGFGRLIRSATDSGRVVVLDPRLVTKPYGRSFLRALPAGVTPGSPDFDEVDPPHDSFPDV